MPCSGGPSHRPRQPRRTPTWASHRRSLGSAPTRPSSSMPTSYCSASDTDRCSARSRPLSACRWDRIVVTWAMQCCSTSPPGRSRVPRTIEAWPSSSITVSVNCVRVSGDGAAGFPPRRTRRCREGAASSARWAARARRTHHAAQPAAAGRHTAHSTLLPRGTCGCASGGTLPSRQGIADGRTLVRAIGEHLGLPLLDDGGLDRGADPGEIDLVALGDVIEATVSSLFPAATSPETLTQFTETVMELLGHASIVLGTRDLPGGDVLQHCMAQVTTILSHLQALSGLDRAEHLSVSLVEQYEAGRILGTRLHELPQQEHAWAMTPHSG